MPTIKIKTGDVRYELENEFGEKIGVIRFNAADPDLLRRADAFDKWIEETQIPDEVTEEQFYQYTDAIKEQIDILLNRKVSDELFGVCNPLAIMADGSCYFVNVVQTIMQIIHAEVSKRMKASAKRVEKAVEEVTGE